MYKMVDISIEKYTDAKVCAITVGNKELFWVRMHDVQEKLMVFFRLKILQKIKQENTKDMKKNWIIIVMLLLCMFVVISCQE